MKNKKTIQLADLHFEHRLWTKELEFWKDEILTFQHRLQEVESRWTDQEVKARVTKFRNQFIRQNDLINDLLNEISGHEQQLSKFAEGHQVTIDHTSLKDHANYREHLDYQRNAHQK